jgi:hypothetical protein
VVSTVGTEFTDRLRSVTQVAMTGTTLRKVAPEIGIGTTVLHRFLRGTVPSGQTINAIVRWLDSKGWRL